MPPIRRNKGSVGKSGASARRIAGRGTPRPGAPDTSPEVPEDEDRTPAESAGASDEVVGSAGGDDTDSPADGPDTDEFAATDADPAGADDPDAAENTTEEESDSDEDTDSDAAESADEHDEADELDEADDDADPAQTYTYDYGDGAEQEKSGSRLRLSKGQGLAAAGIVIGLLAGAGGLFLATGPGLGTENDAFVDETATEEVRTAATSGVQRLVAIDHENLDQYHATLGEYLAPHLVDELNETWDVLRDTYEQTQTAVDAQVREVGVSHLSEDEAEVLLVQDVSMTREGTAAGSTSGTYLVGMEKIDGVWKLSEIPDLPS